MHIVMGFIGAVLSVLILIYRVKIREFIGQIGFAERALGPGGTYTFLVLLGVALFFVSLMIMTGTLNVLFGGVSTDFFRSVK